MLGEFFNLLSYSFFFVKCRWNDIVYYKFYELVEIGDVNRYFLKKEFSG